MDSNISEGRNDVRAAASNLLSIHYSKTRENILELVKSRDKYMYFTAIVIAAVLSLHFSDASNVRPLFIIPFVCLISAIMSVQLEQAIGLRCLWLKNEYTDCVEDLIGARVEHWDSSKLRSTHISSHLYASRGVTLCILYLGSCVISILLILEHYLPNIELLKSEYFLGLSEYTWFWTSTSIFAMISFWSSIIVLKVKKLRSLMVK